MSKDFSILPIVKGEVPTDLPGTLIFGRQWFPWETSEIEQELTSRKIDVILNLLERKHGDVAGAQEIWSPINDYDIPEDELSFINKIDQTIEHLRSGKNVYVHCFAGRGRTSIALAAILVRLGVQPEEALEKVHSLARGPETDKQKDFVRKLSFGSNEPTV